MKDEQSKLPNWLKKRADLSPDMVGIIFEDKEYTFKEIYDTTVCYSKKLYAKGIHQHQVVGVLQNNTIEMVFTIYALMHIGAKIVLFNTRLTNEELSWQFKDAKVQWLITSEFYAHIQPIFPQPEACLYIEQVSKWEESDQFTILEEFDLAQTATIMYTSGTTGFPKGVIQTYGNHWWSAMGSMLNLGLQAEDKWLCTLPLFHISGLSILYKSVIYGMSIILHKQFCEKAANKAILEQGVTIMSVVTATLNRLMYELGEKNYPVSFRCMLLGGGPAPLTLLEKCHDKGIPVFQTYGMTETASQISTLSPQYSFEKVGSAGKALFPSQLKIVKDGKEALSNEIGEILVKGPNVTIGYAHRSEATKQAFDDGWLKTGDMGYCDEEGFLYVVDRRSDLIISGGENIYPAEIENILMKHPAIFEAGITGVEDERWGQVAAAFIVLHENEQADLQSILEHCRKYLATYKIPKYIYIVDELTRNSANKLVRKDLKKLIPVQEKVQ